MAAQVDITNFRLTETSNPVGIDDPTPSVSWSYSIPSAQCLPSWRQQTYILSLRTWPLKSSQSAAETYTVIGPKAHHQSESISWPNAFPRVQSGHVYELSVTTVLAHNSDTNAAWEYGTTNGGHLAPSGIDAAELAAKLINALGTASEAISASSTLTFEGGILGGMEGWRRKIPAIAPITTPWSLEGWQKPEPVPVFKNSYYLKAKPRAARLYATAFGVYKVFINGKPVGDASMAPGWTEYTLRMLYQTYDITEHLQAGENIVSVYVADGWYRGRLGLRHKRWTARRGIFGKETGFMAVLDAYGCESETSVQTFWTGPTSETGWKCIRNSPIQKVEIYDGEEYDARIRVDTAASADWEDVKIISDIWTSDLSTPILQAQIAPPIRPTGETFPVKKFLSSPSGRKILDFGQNIAGKLALKGSAPAGTKLTFLHVEVLEPDGSPCTSILRDALCTDTYTFAGSGLETWEPEFTFHGFRFVEVDGWKDEYNLECVARVYGSDCPRELKSFKTPHALLNRFMENIEWSARANFYAVPTDCPQRDERLGWAGDINLFAPTAFYIFDCLSFLKQWLRGYTDGQKLGGVHRPPIISPSAFEMPGSHRPMAVWEDCLIMLPWNLYKTYRDPRILSELYPNMVEYYIQGIPRDADGLYVYSFQYGDWLDPSTPPDRPELAVTDPMFIANTWLCHVSKTMVKIATVLNKPDDAKMWQEKASHVLSKWRAKYLLPLERTSTNDEPQQLLVWPNYQDMETGVIMHSDDGSKAPDSQTAYSLALNFHLLPDEYIQPAINRLHFLVKKSTFHVATGLCGTAELLHAICYPRRLESSSLQDRLHSLSLAYRMFLKQQDCPSWFYPIVQWDATSIWERWDAVKPDGTMNWKVMTSMNHYALGAVGKWAYENIGGIEMVNEDSPNASILENGAKTGWKSIFDPIPNLEFGITSADMEYESPKGRVECHWKYDTGSKEITIEVAIPANCEGEVRVLGRPVQSIGSGRFTVRSKLDEEQWKFLESYKSY
ncbi:hypothetical protein H072_10959 [Dactylellina haptotyla CBS 200.50]|uniref:alpha-L-rhamnosidase n=1 Tax=Dactylellina haptotyla (strain CBS 200.50) TaxID=1284197 RepID=S8B969_DACHA|nr:hypothetical protein H072_10959 [Dactylellina haptotyla CBS 200.50]